MTTYRVAVIGGTGPQGRGLAWRFARHGHTVLIGSRTEQRAAEAATRVTGTTGLRQSVCRFDGATNRSAKSGSLDTTRPSEVQVREPHVSVGSAHVGFRCAYAGVAK